MNIIELAHRICWRYKHSKDPHHSSTYTFNESTLQQFAKTIRAEALEEAAKVCEQIDTAAFGSERPAPNDCAAAIRGLK